MVDHVNTSVTTQLNLVNLTGTEDAQWMRALKEINASRWGNTFSRLADAQVALESDDTRYLIIIYRDPIWHLTDELGRHTPPAEALVKWQEFVVNLLWLHEGFSDRMTVAMRPSTIQEVCQIAEHLSAATELQCKDITHFTASNRHELPEADVRDNGLTLAAMQLLTLRRSRGLLEKIENITLPALQKPYTPGVISDFLDTQDALSRARIEERKGHKQELASVMKENATLLEQLHRTQEELELYVLRQRELNKKIKGFRRGRDYRREKVAELEEQARELESGMRERDDKIDWLRSVRDQHRRTARGLRAVRRQQEAEMKVLGNRLADMKKQLEAIENSRSWRYTKALRKINGTEK